MVMTKRWWVVMGVMSLAGVSSAQTGACCLTDTGACIDSTQADCTGALQGSWQGNGTACATDASCTTTYGACCMPDECLTAPSFVCAILANEGAVFRGEGVPCSVTTYSETALGTGFWVDMTTGSTPLVFADDKSGFGVTDEGFATVALPADFLFEGIVYSAGTTLNVHTNGFVSFDVIDVTNRPDTFNFRLEFGPDASTPNAAICPLWSDQINVTARTKTVTDAAGTTLVIEWDTDPFDIDRWGGTYQLHMVSSTDPGLDGEIRFLYTDGAAPSPFDAPFVSDDRLMVGMHSVGGLSVFRPSVDGLRTMMGTSDGVSYRPIMTQTDCAVNDCAADINGTGAVDIVDFQLFATAFNSSSGDANYNPDADFNGTGAIDIVDFQLFATEFNRTDCLQ